MKLSTGTSPTETSSTESQTPISKPLLTRILGRLSLAVLLAALAMFVFIKLAHEVGEGETRKFDGAAMLYFRTHPNPLFFSIMTAISWLAGPICQPIVLIGSVIYFGATKRFRPQGATLLIGGIGGVALIVILKHLFHRSRPEAVFQHLGYSFPSRHSFFALVIYGMLAYWLTRDVSLRRRGLVWGLAVLGVLLVGFSRVFIGVHFPSDVASGFLVALPWVWGCLAVGAKLPRSGSTQQSPARTGS